MSQNKKVDNTIQTINSDITDIKTQLGNSELTINVKARVISGMDKISINDNNIQKNNSKIKALSDKLNNNVGMSEQDKETCLQNIKYYSNEVSSSVTQNQETIKEIKNLILDYNSKDNNKFIDFGSDIFNKIQELIQNLSFVDLCILIDILGIIFIFSLIISIIFAYYGNYLINKFSLDEKFPRLSKLISFRVKIQHYSIFFNLALIIITLIVLFIINILTFLR